MPVKCSPNEEAPMHSKYKVYDCHVDVYHNMHYAGGSAQALIITRILVATIEPLAAISAVVVIIFM